MIDPSSIDTVTNLGGTGVIVGAFLWYLRDANKLHKDTITEISQKISQSMDRMSDRVEQLAHAIVSLERRLNEVENKQRKRGRPRKTT